MQHSGCKSWHQSFKVRCSDQVLDTLLTNHSMPFWRPSPVLAEQGCKCHTRSLMLIKPIASETCRANGNQTAGGVTQRSSGEQHPPLSKR